MKYIDADKLIKSVNNYREGAKAALNPIDGDADYYKGKIDACENIQELITSLQQEQPEKILTFGGFVDKVGTWFANLRLDKFRTTFNGEIFPATLLVQEYDLFVQELSKTYSDKQEQPEVDLEKEIKLCWMNWLSPSNQKEVEGILPKTEFEMYAHHFYELGKNARKED